MSDMFGAIGLICRFSTLVAIGRLDELAFADWFQALLTHQAAHFVTSDVKPGVVMALTSRRLP
jgi:hypothetical protein